MTRWQAITEIVKSFNENDKPWHALAALLMLMALPLAVAMLMYAAGTNISPLLTQ